MKNAITNTLHVKKYLEIKDYFFICLLLFIIILLQMSNQANVTIIFGNMQHRIGSKQNLNQYSYFCTL